MTKKQKTATILWKDARIYDPHDKKRASLLSVKCKGEIFKESEDFVILKNCKQFVFDEKKKKFIFKRKTNFFFIPKGMITKIF